LGEDFFGQATLAVARALVGAVVHVCDAAGTEVAGRIVEAEAYLGQEDPASHAARGRTPRSEIMFGPPGRIYVYLIYGVHHCLNFVTAADRTAGAVLVRALEPMLGREIMAARRGFPRSAASTERLCSGPGKLCQALGLDLTWNGRSAVTGSAGPQSLWLTAPTGPVGEPVATPRIGIRRATASLYRFVDPDSRCLSVRYVTEAGSVGNSGHPADKGSGS
jgi:DNA-3-methyladenine glycosylase